MSVNKMGTVRKYIFSSICITTLLLSSSAFGKDFKYAVGGTYSSTDSDADLEITTIVGGAQFFLAPVSTNKGPYAEAGFLDRQTNVLAALGLLTLDIAGFDIDGNMIGASFEYADQSQPITLGVTYNSGNADDNIFGVSVDVSLDILGFEIGYYLNNQSRVSFVYTQTEFEVNASGLGQFKGETDSYAIVYKNVTDLGGNHFANLELGFAMDENDANDTNNVISVLGDYYLDRASGIRGGIALNSGDDTSAEGTTFTIGFLTFPSETVSVGFTFETFSADEPNNDEDTFSLDFEARFM